MMDDEAIRDSHPRGQDADIAVTEGAMGMFDGLI